MFSLLLAVVLPTFGMIAIGMLARRFKIWNESAVPVLNKYAYYMALPALIFTSLTNMSRVDLFNSANAVLVGGVLLAHLIIFAIAAVVLRSLKFSRDLRAVGPMLMTTGATAYIGIPFASYLIGPEGAAYAALLSVFLIVILLFANITLLERAHGCCSNKKILIDLIELPFIWAVLIGGAWVYFGLALPLALSRFLTVLAESAGPTALLGFGAFLYGLKPEQIPWGRSIFFGVVKVLAPTALTVILLSWFGVTGARFVVGVIMAAVSTAISSFLLAEEYKIGKKEAAGAILVSTIASFLMLSLVGWFWLR